MVRKTIDRLRGVIGGREEPTETGLVLTGGGARAAYQAGVLQYISDYVPEARFSVMVGVSAGAINAAHLANHSGTYREAASELVENWRSLHSSDIYEMESAMGIVRSVVLRTLRGNPEDVDVPETMRAFGDTLPLRTYLERTLDTEDGRLTGVSDRLNSGRLRAVAILTTCYTTGQTISWVQGDEFERWERPNRIGINTQLTIDHIMASTSLPFLFPAIQIGDAWYGDGGIRLAAPLAPAIHLGADRILAISTRYNRTRSEADEPVVYGYPPASQIFGLLTNAVFLDALDDDAMGLERINQLLERLPEGKWDGLRPVKLLLLRPSVDLGKLSRSYEWTLPKTMGIFSKLVGTGETESPDWLSMLLFEHDYVSRLIDIGYEDARTQHARIEAFFRRDGEDGGPS
ncbi:MAG: patatin-like phospholipase family protein [Rhodothermales bacterium]